MINVNHIVPGEKKPVKAGGISSADLAPAVVAALSETRRWTRGVYVDNAEQF